MITKSYNLVIKNSSKFKDGEKQYIDISKLSNDSEPLETLVNNLWHLNLENGASEDYIVNDSRIIKISNTEDHIIMDSYIRKDGKEYYAIAERNENLSQAYVYERHNESIYIYKAFDIINKETAFIESELISIENINGSNRQIIHSNITNSLSLFNSDMDIYEISEPVYFNSTDFAICTKYFPISLHAKIYGFDEISNSYIDLKDYIIKIIQHTGEVVVRKKDISAVKIFYFVNPAIQVGSTDQFLNDSSGKYVHLASSVNKAYMTYTLPSEELYIDVVNYNNINISCDFYHKSIESSKNLFINGNRTNRLDYSSQYIISASSNISDNLVELNSNLDIPESVNDINVVVFGLFNTGVYKKLVPISFGASSLPQEYIDMCTNPGINSFNTIVHSANINPPIFNDLIDFDLEVDLSINNHIALPAAANQSTISITYFDGTNTLPFTNYEYQEPDLIIFDKDYINLNYQYRIQFTSYVSPIVSYINTDTKRIELLSSGDIYSHYSSLEKLFILCDDIAEIRFKNESNIATEKYYENTLKIKIKPSREYIRKSLDSLKKLIIGN